MSTTIAILLGGLVLLALHLATRVSRRRAQASRQEQCRQVTKRLNLAPTPVCLHRNAAAEHRALQRRVVAAKREQDAVALHAARLMLAIAQACRDDRSQR